MFRAALIALGLLFLLQPPPASAVDFGDCATGGYLAHFDPRLSDQPCDVIATADIHWRGGVAHLRAIHPRAMPISDTPALAARVQELAAAVGTAMDAMGGNFRIDNVTVLMTNYVSPREGGPDEGFDKGGYIAGANSTFAHECPVSYYKGMHPTTGDEFVFTLAHELFHCMQYRNWAHAFDEGWLLEGSAEYFAYLAKPGYGAGFIPLFANQTTTTPLNRFSYPSVVFWLWLGHAHGAPAVPGMLASYRGNLEETVPADMWIDFAQAYFGESIKLPDGRALPASPRMGGTHTFRSDEHVASPTFIPYTLNQMLFTFERGHLFNLTHAANPADVRVNWRVDNAGMWLAPLTTVTTCEAEQRYRVIWASTHSTQGGAMDIRVQPATAAVCTCPAGTWQETPASTRHMTEQSATGGASNTRYIAGTRILQLNPDHTGSFTYQSVESETHGNPDFWLHQVKTGGTHFTWRVISNVLYTVLTPGDNLLTLHNDLHAGGGVTVETRRAGAQSIGHNYSCDGPILHLTQHNIPPSPIPGMGARISVDMDFVRLGAAPEPTPGH